MQNCTEALLNGVKTIQNTCVFVVIRRILLIYLFSVISCSLFCETGGRAKVVARLGVILVVS